jgi:hypothetical protein
VTAITVAQAPVRDTPPAINGNSPAPQKRRRRVVTERNTGHREAAAIRELTADELDLVSGGKGSKTKEQPQEYMVVTLKEVFVSS